MTDWRVGRGWSRAELLHHLAALETLPVSFVDAPEQMTPARGWNRYFSESVIAREPPGEPVAGGPFRRARAAVAGYRFSDPDIVIGHFDSSRRLLHRTMLLELRTGLGPRYLAGVVINAVRRAPTDAGAAFGFRYDTLEGHFERGWEWVLLTKDRASGEIRFRIDAAWVPGEFPNWWSRAGFRWLGPRYQERWHRAAHARLRRIAQVELAAFPCTDSDAIAHGSPEVVFERITPPGPRSETEHTILAP